MIALFINVIETPETSFFKEKCFHLFPFRDCMIMHLNSLLLSASNYW